MSKMKRCEFCGWVSDDKVCYCNPAQQKAMSELRAKVSALEAALAEANKREALVRKHWESEQGESSDLRIGLEMAEAECEVLARRIVGNGPGFRVHEVRQEAQAKAREQGNPKD